MPRVAPLVEQAQQLELRSQYRVQRRVLNRQTFNSKYMWGLVAAVWVVAGGVLVVGLSRLG